MVDTWFEGELPSWLMRPSPSWISVPPDEPSIKRLSRELRISPLLAHLLIVRGIKEPEEAHRHLYPRLIYFADPFLLPDMERAIRRLVRAVRQREKIAIYGDYDVDGTTGAAVLYLFLRELGLDPVVLFPHRERDGYGFHASYLPRLKQEGVKLIITTDCGVTSQEACSLARELGIEVIVTDHHEVPPKLPPALAVINPKRKDSRYPFRELAGVGVTFALVRALRQALYEEGFFEEVPNLKRYLDLVALGTIADIVPLTGENRLIACFGLKELTETSRPGLLALKEIAGVRGEVGTTEVIYRLAPRLNAAGRLKEARLAFELLVTDEPAKAGKLAEELHRLNAERQRLEERILREALQQIEGRLSPERWAYVLAGEDWPLGVIGIVASRLQEFLYRPVILLTKREDVCRGSGRSIPEVDLYRCLSLCREHLLSFGGHPAAAGLKLSLEKLEDFVRSFEEIVAREMAGERPVPSLRLDAWVKVKHLLDPQFIEGYIRLGPFGPGYPEPLFGLRGFEVRRPTIVKDKHFKFFLWQEGLSLEAICFGFGPEIPQAVRALAGNLDFSSFQGRQYLQFRVRDLKTNPLGDEK